MPRRSSKATTCAQTSPTTAAAMDVAIFLDGPIHDGDYQQQKDEDAQPKLEDEAGWTGAAVPLQRRRRRMAGEDRRRVGDVFGPGKSGT